MNFVYSDPSRNLLHIIVVDTLDLESAKKLIDEIKAVCLQLRQGFDVLSDFRELKTIQREATPLIDELMEFLNGRGAKRVVRILPNEMENFGLAIMSIFHYGKSVKFSSCLSLEEAGVILADE